MFKGLRTKIESEQKDQGTKGTGPGLATTTSKTSSSRSGEQSDAKRTTLLSQAQSSTSTAQISIPTVPAIYPPHYTNNEFATKKSAETPLESLTEANTSTAAKSTALISTDLRRDTYPNSSLPSQTTELSELASKSNPSYTASGNDATVNELENQISRLRERLQAVIKERDQDADLATQFKRLVATLQRDLEQERAAKTALESRLREVETKSKEQTDNIDKISTTNRAANNNPFIKSFNPDGHCANINESNLSNDLGVLKHEIIDLHAQLAKKNRQLKISQQNLTDMKRSLQREILEHGRTQDELAKLQKQIKCEQEPPNRHASDAPTHTQNGTRAEGQPSDSTANQVSGDKCRESVYAAASSQTGNLSEDAISFNAALSNPNQFDRVSCMSRSSASVDDLESNDLQSSNHKEVSHEYLRNVLFRYMTSTDIETTQHLVKAISVLMDFTPEQSASIKSAMNSRATSWLRLK